MKAALITGCSRPTGFGQLTAKKFARNDYRVFASMRRAERGAELSAWADSEGLRLRILEHDVTDPEQNLRVVDQIVAATGRLDALVNNVGVSSFGALETLRPAHIQHVMETNFFSALDMTRAALPVMRENGGGRIIFVTSMAGVTGVPGESVYCASKFALEGLAESLAMEVRRFGIHVSTVRPAFFNTGMSTENTDASDFFEQDTPYDGFNDRVVATTSHGEAGGEDPQIVADTIYEAATTDTPKLRWDPGASAPEILAARRETPDEAWRDYVMSELGLADWLEPVAAD